MSRKEVNNEQAQWEREKKHKDALIRFQSLRARILFLCGVQEWVMHCAQTARSLEHAHAHAHAHAHRFMHGVCTRQTHSL